MLANPTYRSDIDGLRGIAVLGVVIFHAFPTHLPGGFVGVDIFFVISGYLISSILCNELDAGSFSFLQFYDRRVRRILPSLILVLLASTLLGWYLLLPAEYKKLGAHISAGCAFSSNFLLSSESAYFDDASHNKPLLHLWSLAIEEQFYIIWPMFLYVSKKARLNLFTLTFVLALSSFTLSIIKTKIDSTQAFYWPTTRGWELLLGACVAFIISYPKAYFQPVQSRLDSFFVALIYGDTFESDGTTLRNVISTAGTVLIVFSVSCLTKAASFPGWWAVAPTMGTCGLVAAGPTAWINRKILSSRFLTGIGLISYPLYLWHWPLLVYTCLFVGHNVSAYTHIALICLSILIAIVTYVLIERKFRFGKSHKVKGVFLSVCLVASGLTGYLIYRADGLPNRFPRLIQDITNAEQYFKNWTQQYRLFSCFLDTDQDESKFGMCVDNKEKPVLTSVVLWGDSYAAHLHPGIVAARSDVRVTQLTASGCPPIIELHIRDRPNCKKINDYVLKRISSERANTVVLAAFWGTHDWKRLTTTIANLKNITVQRVYLVGPVPHWVNGLPRALYNYFLQDGLHRLPSRMSFSLDPTIRSLDEAMQDFATKMHVEYISPYKVFCNNDGCLTRTGESADTLMAWDYGHLTAAGSNFLVSNFPKKLLHPT